MQDGLNLLLQHVNITQYTNHNNLNDVSDPYRYLDLFSMAFRIRAPKWIRILAFFKSANIGKNVTSLFYFCVKIITADLIQFQSNG